MKKETTMMGDDGGEVINQSSLINRSQQSSISTSTTAMIESVTESMTWSTIVIGTMTESMTEENPALLPACADEKAAPR